MRSGGECSLPLTVPVCCRANRFSHDRKHFDWYLSYVSGKTSLLGSPRNHSSFPKVQTRDVGGKKAEWGNFSSVLELQSTTVISYTCFITRLPMQYFGKDEEGKIAYVWIHVIYFKTIFIFLFYCSKWCNLLHTNLIWSEHSGSIKWAITVHKSKFHIGKSRLVFINVVEHPTQYAFNSCKKKEESSMVWIDLKVAPAPLFNISKCSRVFDDLDERYLPVMY